MSKLGSFSVTFGLILALLGAILGFAQIFSATAVSLSGLTFVLVGLANKYFR
jgi:membrane-bound ClpP family serine protease